MPRPTLTAIVSTILLHWPNDPSNRDAHGSPFPMLDEDVRSFVDGLSDDEVESLVVDALIADGSHRLSENDLGRRIEAGVYLHARLPNAAGEPAGRRRFLGTWFPDDAEDDGDWEVNPDVWDIIDRLRARVAEG